MSMTLINRITIKKNGVYMSCRCSNDSRPYRSCRINSLSDIYKKEGQLGLDREIINLIADCGVLKGNHKSVQRYRDLFTSQQYKDVRNKFLKLINDAYGLLSKEDTFSIWRKPTPKAENYLNTKNALLQEMYTELAKLLS